VKVGRKGSDPFSEGRKVGRKGSDPFLTEGREGRDKLRRFRFSVVRSAIGPKCSGWEAKDYIGPFRGNRLIIKLGEYRICQVWG